MNFFPSQGLDDVLAELAEANPFLGQIRKCADHAEHIALRRVRVPAQEEIRARQVKEVKRMGLDELSHMLQLSEELGGFRISTPRIASHALAEASWWLTGQMPQMRWVITGISSKGLPSQKRSYPLNWVTWNCAPSTSPLASR